MDHSDANNVMNWIVIGVGCERCCTEVTGPWFTSSSLPRTSRGWRCFPTATRVSRTRRRRQRQQGRGKGRCLSWEWTRSWRPICAGPSGSLPPWASFTSTSSTKSTSDSRPCSTWLSASCRRCRFFSRWLTARYLEWCQTGKTVSPVQLTSTRGLNWSRCRTRYRDCGKSSWAAPYTSSVSCSSSATAEYRWRTPSGTFWLLSAPRSTTTQYSPTWSADSHRRRWK